MQRKYPPARAQLLDALVGPGPLLGGAPVLQLVPLVPRHALGLGGGDQLLAEHQDAVALNGVHEDAQLESVPEPRDYAAILRLVPDGHNI